MSELKVYKMIDKDYCDDSFCIVPSDVYIKSEVDEVICHQKYKRCVAIAQRCFTKSNYHFHLARSGEDSKENIRKDALYTKWRHRWLNIAEQFKEAK